MPRSPSLFRLVFAPALLTLIVTLVRLVGERMGWPPQYFSTASGGGSALVGIVWLVPVFGAWFGFQLARQGDGPRRPWRVLLLHVIALALYVGGFQLVIRLFDSSTRAGLEHQLLGMGAAAVLAALVSLFAWRRQFCVELLYAVLARAPIVVITYLAVLEDWSTHFEKLGPKDYQGFEPMERAWWLAYLQLVAWPAFTVVVGGLFGAAAAIVGRRRTV